MDFATSTITTIDNKKKTRRSPDRWKRPKHAPQMEQAMAKVPRRCARNGR
jgi:hypothetical protein